ncbi:MAG: thiopeptide-type bacteriocin biosynthesis protein [Chloroflexi bacterium]|nr:thiopeptide-type bacteriocin biosynthesis protein [Chloroflexota bacterium]
MAQDWLPSERIYTMLEEPREIGQQILQGILPFDLPDDDLDLVGRLLAYSSECLDNHGHSEPNSSLCEQASRFLRGGIEAIQSDEAAGRWVQLGVEFSTDRPCRDFYQRLVTEVQDLLATGRVGNWFFMHKPPGMRLRFETGANAHSWMENHLDQLVSTWQSDGVIEAGTFGTYEPEHVLFGGRDSIPYVHRFFTLDSMAWIKYHAQLENDPNDETSNDPAWALSLAMMQALFSGLDITGWEDLGVWDHVRRKTGRRLFHELLSSADFTAAADEIRQKWRHTNMTADLSSSTQWIAEEFNDGVLKVAGEWRHDYFDTRLSTIGPREVAAFCVIFHWNRANLSIARQATLTEALATWEAI